MFFNFIGKFLDFLLIEDLWIWNIFFFYRNVCANKSNSFDI